MSVATVHLVAPSPSWAHQGLAKPPCCQFWLRSMATTSTFLELYLVLLVKVHANNTPYSEAEFYNFASFVYQNDILNEALTVRCNTIIIA